MNIVTIGIDLAKNVFALHGVDQSGKAVLIKPKVVRCQLLHVDAHMQCRLIGMGPYSSECYEYKTRMTGHGRTLPDDNLISNWVLRLDS